MTTLREMAAEYRELLAAVEVEGPEPGAETELTVPATGEVVTQDEFLRRLYALEGDIERKVDGCAAVVKELLANAAVLKEEEARLAARRKSHERRADEVKSYLGEQMAAVGREKVKTLRYTVYFGAEGEDLFIDDASAVPDAFLRPFVPPTREELLNRVALRTELRKNEVPGARLEKNGRRPVIIR